MTRGAAGLAAAMCVGISLFAFSRPGRAADPPPPSTVYEQSGSLQGLGTYVIRQDPGAATAAIELWFRAPAPGYSFSEPGVSRVALAALASSAGTRGVSLAQLVARAGGTLSLNVYPDIAMVGASVPSWDADAVLRTMTSAFFSADVSDSGFHSGQRDCAVAAAQSEFDADRTLQDALFSRLFSGGPAHFPPTPTQTSDCSKLTVEQVKHFAQRAFRPQNAVLSLAGNVSDKWTADVRSAAGGGRGDGPIDSQRAQSPGGRVAQRAAVSGIGYAWSGPPITDTKAATAMDFIADYAFDADHGTLARTLRDRKADAILNGQFITLHDPGVLLVTVSGATAEQADASIAQTVQSLQTPLDRGTFDAARAAFEYHILSQVQTPQERADNFGWYAAEGNLSYAPSDRSGTYLDMANSLDPGYVAQIARTYLQHPAIVELTPARAGAST